MTDDPCLSYGRGTQPQSNGLVALAILCSTWHTYDCITDIKDLDMSSSIEYTLLINLPSENA
jgi:hypothetical protein